MILLNLDFFIIKNKRKNGEDFDEHPSDRDTSFVTFIVDGMK